eukprot:scaffold5070_cov145-Skeletonema_menzelii.AAC.3
MASQAVLMNGPVALLFAVILLLLSSAAAGVYGFQLLPVSTVVSRHHTSQHTRGRAHFNSANNNDEATTEAERLLSKAKAIREELGSHNTNNQQLEGKSPIQIRSEFCLPATSSGSNNNDYRLYLDVGREPGTWMDPRWGASGRRIECTIDVSFSSVDEEEQSLSEEITSGLIKTVTTKSSKLSQVLKLQHAPFARLRSGFDKMKISEGGYCIESASKSSTMRFCLSVNGTEGSTASYGDVSIPQGNLYFALPYFGTSQSDGSISISKKEGTICVKQFGWNTGWRREESRILGVFRAAPLVEARRRDKF